MVPQHGSFSLHTMLEGLRLHKMAFPTPMVWPLDESQGSSPLEGHGSWLMCEVALKLSTFFTTFLKNDMWSDIGRIKITFDKNNYERLPRNFGTMTCV